mgnify:CR=1 FL=1
MENELVNLNENPFGIVTDDVQESSVPLVDIGMSDEVLNEAIDFIEGKKQSIDYLEKFKADNNSKIKDYALLATLAQLTRVPNLVQYLRIIYSRLFSNESLAEMDPKDLATLGRNLSGELNSVMESSRKTLDMLERMNGTSNDYEDLLDGLLSQTPEDLRAMKEFLDARKNSGSAKEETNGTKEESEDK